MAELVPRVGGEDHVPRRCGRLHGAHDLEEQHEPAAALGRAAPPAAARRHDHHRREVRIAAGDPRGNVVRGRLRAVRVDHHRRRGAGLGGALERAPVFVRELQNRRAEGAGEVVGIDRGQAGRLAEGDVQHGRVAAAAARRLDAAVAACCGFDQPDLGIAAQQAEPSGNAGGSRRRPVEARQALIGDAGNRRLRGHDVDAVEGKGNERGRDAEAGDLVGEPARGGAVYIRSGPVDALCVIRRDNPRNTVHDRRPFLPVTPSGY